MPMLAVVEISIALRRSGSRMTSSKRSASSTASASRSRPAARMANSSPPSRAKVSPLRKQLARRREAWMRNSSPTPWPLLSLMSLKRSKSRKSTAKARPGPLSLHSMAVLSAS